MSGVPGGAGDHAAVQELLAAYALDALEPEEAATVSAHLEACPRCRNEVDAYREVAAALGNASEAVPSHLWDRIAEGVARGWDEHAPPARALPPPSLPQREDGPHTARRSRNRPWPWIAAAAVVVLVAGLSVELVNLQHQIDQRQPPSAAGGRPGGNGGAGGGNSGGSGLAGGVVGALATPGHEVASLQAPDGHPVAQAVVADGRGYLVAERLPTLGRDRTYQLWGLFGKGPVSLGLLGSRPTVAAFSVGSGAPSTLMLTVEPGGGVPVPDRSPLARGNLS